MHPKSPKLLDDIADASSFVAEITANATLAEFIADRRLRQVVERNFEIIGEALSRLGRTDPDTMARISDCRDIIGLRNVLIHNYDEIDRQRVWRIIKESLPILQREVTLLLEEAEADWTADESSDTAG
jgi:uncharacterized protein with HEPN domain